MFFEIGLDLDFGMEVADMEQAKRGGLRTPSHMMKRRSTPTVMVSDTIAALRNSFVGTILHSSRRARSSEFGMPNPSHFDFSPVPGFKLWCLLVHLLPMVSLE